VDSITHATLGAALGELVLGKRLGNRAMAWGAVFGTLPDMDMLISPWLSTATNLWWHRGPSHSLLVMILASLLLARPLCKLWKREKIGFPLAAWFVFLAWSTHVLVDCFTVYGTSVFWPFLKTRIAFNDLFIIDPLFTLPMLATLVRLAFLRDKSQLPQRRRWNYGGLAAACAYVLLAIGMKSICSAGFKADLTRRGVHHERRMETPTAFNIFLWRSAVDRDNEIWVGYRSVFDSSSTPVRWTIYPKNLAAINNVKQLPEFQTVDWFSDGWWIARPHVKGVWIGDMRFGETRDWDNREGMVDLRLSFTWDILPRQAHERLRPQMRAPRNIQSTLSHLGKRLVGNQDDWESEPRLEGVTGHLPELLAVER
jgi:inner membrane protein